jgi:hypothetical protein
MDIDYVARENFRVGAADAAWVGVLDHQSGFPLLIEESWPRRYLLKNEIDRRCVFRTGDVFLKGESEGEARASN